MTDKELDALIASAFDEADPADMATANQLKGMNPKAAKEAEFLALMRSDLKAMNDVPECQLTTERMRQAILSQGLKPTPRVNWFARNWGYFAGAAACALALGLVLPRQISGGTDGSEVATTTLATAAPTETSPAPLANLAPATEMAMPAEPSTPTASKMSVPAESISRAPVRTAVESRSPRRPAAKRVTKPTRNEGPLLTMTATPKLAENNVGMAAAAIASGLEENQSPRPGVGAGGTAGFAMPGGAMTRGGAGRTSIILIDPTNVTTSGTGQAVTQYDGDVLFGG